jgi:hypothetical protein
MAIDTDSARSHEKTRATFHCAACGYGARRTHAPPRCPMCGGETWTQETRPRTDFDFDLDPITRVESETNELDADQPLQRERQQTATPGAPLS